MPLLRLSFANALSLPILCFLLSGALSRVLLDSDAEMDAELNGLAINENTGRCSHLLMRQEWRTLSDAHKAEYIRAVKCTRTLPKITSYRGVQSRFDDFQAVHIHTAASIHWAGHFLPWHRRFVTLYEKTLRDECGFRGAIPYWDWTQDVAGNKSQAHKTPNFDNKLIRTSPVFDPVTGFGGDGVKGTYTLPGNITAASQVLPSTFGGCVMDGPFGYNASDPNSFAVHVGPGKLVTTHCLVRGIDDSYKRFLSADVVKHALEQQTYEQFRLALEGGVDDDDSKSEESQHEREEAVPDNDSTPVSEHASGHMVVGGELGNLYSSPGEPLFFLHHANLDRIWWNWQVMDLDRRLIDMSGNIVSSNPHENSTQDMDLDTGTGEEQDDDDGEYDGIDSSQLNASSTVTLDVSLRFGPLGRKIPIRDIMDITSFPSCYLYV
ncbi:hypothetical protein CVT25_001881 [Psilocybe cyanescens]|uniref:Tyrosinase copper-binding domain-containing protein n=1 Tax=Psilocybe cyanescens TaxID=93625 RepID=A0A409WQU7_PSICY|nr:hypothetical protein CVT25_001881 [Psilocybe cyanescens]